MNVAGGIASSVRSSSASTLAVRVPPVNSDASPNTSPARRKVRSSRAPASVCLNARARPLRITNAGPAGSPSRKTSCPSGTVTSSRPSSRSDSDWLLSPANALSVDRKWRR